MIKKILIIVLILVMVGVSGCKTFVFDTDPQPTKGKTIFSNKIEHWQNRANNQ